MIDAREKTAAEAFDEMADEFAALAEASTSVEQCVRYRDLEHDYRMRATEERARHIENWRYVNGRALAETQAAA